MRDGPGVLPNESCWDAVAAVVVGVLLAVAFAVPPNPPLIQQELTGPPAQSAPRARARGGQARQHPEQAHLSPSGP